MKRLMLHRYQQQKIHAEIAIKHFSFATEIQYTHTKMRHNKKMRHFSNFHQGCSNSYFSPFIGKY
jgi:hypothetical protein